MTKVYIVQEPHMWHTLTFSPTAAFTDKNKADEFAGKVDGHVIELPLNPSFGKWYKATVNTRGKYGQTVEEWFCGPKYAPCFNEWHEAVGYGRTVKEARKAARGLFAKESKR